MKVVTRINELKYDFERQLKQEQLRLEMSSAEFAKHIGMHKSWLLKLWSATEPRHPLSEKTMALINNRVGISYDTMINYNEEVMRDRG